MDKIFFGKKSNFHPKSEESHCHRISLDFLLGVIDGWSTQRTPTKGACEHRMVNAACELLQFPAYC